MKKRGHAQISTALSRALRAIGLRHCYRCHSFYRSNSTNIWCNDCEYGEQVVSKFLKKVSDKNFVNGVKSTSGSGRQEGTLFPDPRKEIYGQDGLALFTGADDHRPG